jgi:hypothetical protein
LPHGKPAGSLRTALMLVASSGLRQCSLKPPPAHARTGSSILAVRRST